MTLGERAKRRRRRVRTGATAVLAGCLAGVLIYLVLPGGSAHGGPCDPAGAPRVASVAPLRLAPLREAVARVVPQRVGRLYEEGTVTSSAAWTDDQPAPPAVSASAPRPAGYEMRWWAPNGDDVAADVFDFHTAAEAQRFFVLASAAGCRSHGDGEPSSRPPLARNLAWVNPDGAAEADVYLLRGTRVYRVVDAPARARGGNAAALHRAFSLVDTLSCLLPGAQCATEGRSVPV